MAVLLGVLVALSFGTGDFVGGQSTARASAVGTLVIAQACAFAGAIVLALTTTAAVSRGDLVLGAFAGAAIVLGLGLLYHALARYEIGVVAPVTAVIGAVVPVAWGLLQGERPSTLALFGIVLAIAAGALIAREPGQRSGGWAAGAFTAALAGVALGASLVLFAETSSDSGMWPLFSARTSAAVLVWAVALVLVARRTPPALPRGRSVGLAVTAGVLDVAGNALMLLAVRRGLIVIVAPIASLAPGFTVVLAWALLGEQLSRIQRIGVVCALAGVALVATG